MSVFDVFLLELLLLHFLI